MNKFQQLLTALTFFIITQISAQQKYALVVGINQYYDKPGVVHPSVLQGCVDDALSIKGMLVQRFGFSSNQIKTLLNEDATKNNVQQAFADILDKCKAGDVFIFYFSGHGVWMNNNGQNILDNEVKNKMNQAMVMSDLYSDKLGCLFTDALVKKTFNKFIDKQVIATGIFDCCFSGKISAMPGFDMPHPYDDEGDATYTEKSISFSEIFSAFEDSCMHKPGGCDMLSLNDTMHRELDEGANTKAFNLNASIAINDSNFIKRPFERPNSRFLSLAATNDVEKGLEIKDDAGTYHGAFTKALLYAIKNSPSDITVAKLVQKASAQMKRQMYMQTPTHLQDSNRLQQNLLGIKTSALSNTITATCLAKTNKLITLNAGLSDGLAIGNILGLLNNTNKVKIQITGIRRDTAFATVTAGSMALIKTGDRFMLTDGYVISTPLVKVYLQAEALTPAAFEEFTVENIIPLSKLDNYWDYENWYFNKLSRNIFFNDTTYHPGALAKQYLSGVFKDNFLVFLPIPTYVTTPLAKLLQSNQNIQLVGSQKEADLVLYLNYTIAKNQKDKPGFLFTWFNFNGSDFNISSLKFSSSFVKVPSLNLTGQQIKKLSADLLAMTTVMARRKSNQWLNDYPLR